MNNCMLHFFQCTVTVQTRVCSRTVLKKKTEMIIKNNFSVFVCCLRNVVLACYVRSHPVRLLGAKPPLSLKPSDTPCWEHEWLLHML